MQNYFSFACHQTMGKRPYQEDSYRVLTHAVLPEDKTGHLAVLCDGMGGHNGGAIASEIISETFVRVFESSSDSIQARLHHALSTANASLAERVSREPALKGMGATLIAVFISEGETKGQYLLNWISVGVSPLMLLRNQGLKRLNEDHSMAPVFEKMVEMGQLTAEAARNDSKRHTLRSAVSGGEIRMVDATSQPFVLASGDQLIIASDGIDTLSQDEITQNLLKFTGTSCEQSLDNLFQQLEAKDNPEQDNTSVILMRISESELAGNTLESGTAVKKTDQLHRHHTDYSQGQQTAGFEGTENALLARRTSISKKLWLTAVSMVVVAIAIFVLILYKMSGNDAPDQVSPAEVQLVTENKPDSSVESTTDQNSTSRETDQQEDLTVHRAGSGEETDLPLSEPADSGLQEQQE